MRTYAILLVLLQCVNFKTFSQSIPVFSGVVSEKDRIDPVKDKEFGVGDDGIYNIVEPSVKATSCLVEDGRTFAAKNAADYNLGTPWIEGKPDYGIGEYLEFCFDLRERGDTVNAFSINGMAIINGYRKNENTWKANTRVKKLKMYVNGKPFAYIPLKDTYKYQWFPFPDYWLKYGTLTIIKLEIVEIYAGEKYSDTAISEIQFSGRYSENM